MQEISKNVNVPEPLMSHQQFSSVLLLNIKMIQILCYRIFPVKVPAKNLWGILKHKAERYSRPSKLVTYSTSSVILNVYVSPGKDAFFQNEWATLRGNSPYLSICYIYSCLGPVFKYAIYFIVMTTL